MHYILFVRLFVFLALQPIVVVLVFSQPSSGLFNLLFLEVS